MQNTRPPLATNSSSLSSDSCMMEIGNTLPLSTAQYDALVRLRDAMGSGDEMLFRASNHADFDDFMAVYLKWRDYGFHVELDFPMEDFGWKYPLVLAAGLRGQSTKQLLRELVVNLTGTGENEVVQNRFRQVSAQRYGEKKAEEYRKDAEADWGKEN